MYRYIQSAWCIFHVYHKNIFKDNLKTLSRGIFVLIQSPARERNTVTTCQWNLWFYMTVWINTSIHCVYQHTTGRLSTHNQLPPTLASRTRSALSVHDPRQSLRLHTIQQKPVGFYQVQFKKTCPHAPPTRHLAGHNIKVTNILYVSKRVVCQWNLLTGRRLQTGRSIDRKHQVCVYWRGCWINNHYYSNVDDNDLLHQGECIIFLLEDADNQVMSTVHYELHIKSNISDDNFNNLESGSSICKVSCLCWDPLACPVVYSLLIALYKYICAAQYL